MVVTCLSIITASVFQTVEFYVIVSVIAAAVIALTSLPERKGEVKLYLIAGQLFQQTDNSTSTEVTSGTLHIEVQAGNIVNIRREGLEEVTMNGAVSLAVKVSGFDIVIEERITPGNVSAEGVANSVVFRFDFLAPEWYHIRYESERFGEHAAFTLHVREGIVMRKVLIR